MNIEQVKTLLKEFDYDKNTDEDLYYLLLYIVDKFLSREYVSKSYIEDLIFDLKQNDNSSLYDTPVDLLEDILAYMEESI